MRIGVPKEIKNHEYRVGITPSIARALVQKGHQVLIQAHAGVAVGFSNEAYQEAGATVVGSATEVYAADFVIKVKEPQAIEYPFLRKGQTLFCYLHLAADPQQTKALLDSGVTAIAYETVIDAAGRLPLLTPMSEIAGRIAIQAAATSLQIANGGKGILLGGVPGVLPARVLVIGGGVVGTQAARIALGAGADVTILDKNLDRLRALDDLFGPRLKTSYSSSEAIENLVPQSDVIIGAVLIPGKKAPHLVSRKLIAKMEKASVVVDVAIDQGGCFETSRPTSHSQPTYIEESVVHYCVSNMPGACARTATMALTNATESYIFEIAEKGPLQALRSHKGLRMGLNIHEGKVCNQAVAEDMGYPFCMDIFDTK